MGTLCVTTNLTSSELAAWVQAIGSILAIIGALGAALWQARVQHRNALALFATQQRHSRTELAKTLATLTTNCARAIDHMANQLASREAIQNVAEGRIHFDRGELAHLVSAMAGIPLHELPYSLVSPTMIVGAILRQYEEKIDLVMKFYRTMDAAEYADFFKVQSEMGASLRETCEEVRKIVEHIGD